MSSEERIRSHRCRRRRSPRCRTRRHRSSQCVRCRDLAIAQDDTPHRGTGRRPRNSTPAFCALLGFERGHARLPWCLLRGRNIGGPSDLFKANPPGIRCRKPPTHPHGSALASRYRVVQLRSTRLGALGVRQGAPGQARDDGDQFHGLGGFCDVVLAARDAAIQPRVAASASAMKLAPSSCCNSFQSALIQHRELTSAKRITLGSWMASPCGQYGRASREHV